MDRKDALTVSIHDLERRKEELETELEQITRNLNTLKAQHATLTNQKHSPIYRLPNELLMSIFIFQRDILRKRNTSTSDQYIFHAKVLARVSRHWKDVVFNTPLLWNIIKYRSSTKKHLSYLDAHLLYSGSAPLDITVDFLPATHIDLHLARLVCHASRWQKLSIFSAERSETVDSALRNLHTPMLEYLSVTTGSFHANISNISVTTPGIPTMCLSDTMSLRFLRLAGHALGSMYPPLKNITVLHLDGWAKPHMTEHTLAGILEALSSIIHLSFNQVTIHHSRDPSVLSPVVTLPHLMGLRIRGPCSAVARFFAMMVMPSLHNLTIRYIYNMPTTPCMKSVRSLSVQECDIDDQEFGALIRAMPDLTVLEVDEGPAVFRMLNPNEEEYIGGTQLNEMRINGMTTMDAVVFHSMVIARRDSTQTKTIDTIYLDRRSRTSLRHRGTLHELSEGSNVLEFNDLDDSWPAGLIYDDVHDYLE